MKLPKISVVIPSYNKSRYIEQTLQSIIGQNYQNTEIIIQDGGSGDGTVSIIKDYARKHPKIIKWQSQKDDGQMDAINKGFKKATGEIVTYINADDVYKKGAFSEVAKAFEKNPDALWFAGGGSVIDENGNEIVWPVTLYKSFCLRLNRRILLLVFNYLMQPSVFLTKRAWEKYGQFTGIKEFVTEYDKWLKISGDEMPVVINKTLSEFRIEENTTTKQMSSRLLLEDMKVVKKYTSNSVILFLHKLHNWGRTTLGKTL